jgi:hypothetical protein
MKNTLCIHVILSSYVIVSKTSMYLLVLFLYFLFFCFLVTTLFTVLLPLDRGRKKEPGRNGFRIFKDLTPTKENFELVCKYKDDR